MRDRLPTTISQLMKLAQIWARNSIYARVGKISWFK